ncbi:MAG: TlpA family protein disulfide reductase [Candidatus Rokubacteria bacterium]|nr:TlpA family protein disulfide reductase [Candidatus Rokubacteria bacterium]
MRPRVSVEVVGILAVVALVGAVVATAAGAPEAMKALQVLEPKAPTPAPDVTLRTLQGTPLSIKALKGKVVLVNFWATWCLPCQWEMPLMENLYQAYKAKGFVIAAISLDQDGAETAVGAFVSARKLTYPILLDPTFQGAKQFGVRGLPATFLIGKDGYIKGVTYGPREWDGPEARTLIESLLAARGSKG